MSETILHNSDCIQAMKALDEHSVDLVVTDPPYNLGNFMIYEYFYDDEAKVKKALDCIQGTDFEVDSTAGRRIRIIKRA